MSSWPPYPTSPISEQNFGLQKSLSEAGEVNQCFWQDNESTDNIKKETEAAAAAAKKELNLSSSTFSISSEIISSQSIRAQPTIAVPTASTTVSTQQISNPGLRTPPAATTLTFIGRFPVDSDSPPSTVQEQDQGQNQDQSQITSAQPKYQKCRYSKERREKQRERVKLAAVLDKDRYRAIEPGDSGPPRGDDISSLVQGDPEESSRKLAEALLKADLQIRMNVIRNIKMVTRPIGTSAGTATATTSTATMTEGASTSAAAAVPDNATYQLLRNRLPASSLSVADCPKNMLFGDMNICYVVKTLLKPRCVKDYELIDSEFMDLVHLQKEISLSENATFTLPDIAHLLFPSNIPSVVQTPTGSTVAISCGISEQYRVLLRFCRYEPGARIQRDYIPSGLLLILNKQTFRLCAPRAPHFQVQPKETPGSMQAPFDLTDYLRTAWSERHETTINFRPIVDPKLRETMGPMEQFYFGVYLVKRINFSDWWNVFVRRWTAEPLSPENAIEMSKSVFANSVNKVTVSLQCPLTGARIGTPVRSYNCTSHLQCFDGQSMIIRNQQMFFWTCPVESCGVPIKLEDLFIDGLYLEILSVAPASCDGADVYRDGQWRCITKVVDFTVTVIDRREVELMTAQAAAQAQSAAQARSITGAITVNQSAGVPGPGPSANNVALVRFAQPSTVASASALSSARNDEAQQIRTMTEGVSRVVQIREEGPGEDGNAEVSSGRNYRAPLPIDESANGLRNGVKRSTEELAKVTSPFSRPNIPRKRSTRVSKSTKNPEFHYE